MQLVKLSPPADPIFVRPPHFPMGVDLIDKKHPARADFIRHAYDPNYSQGQGSRQTEDRVRRFNGSTNYTQRPGRKEENPQANSPCRGPEAAAPTNNSSTECATSREHIVLPATSLPSLSSSSALAPSYCFQCTVLSSPYTARTFLPTSSTSNRTAMDHPVECGIIDGRFSSSNAVANKEHGYGRGVSKHEDGVCR